MKPRNQKKPRLIPVGTSDWALVDEGDFERLSRRYWTMKDGYAYRHLNTKERAPRNGRKGCISMHRDILGQTSPDVHSDHINHNGLDNRRCNLRAVTRSENCTWTRKRFHAKPDRHTSSQFRGVYFRKDRQRWSAYVGTGKKRICLGCFELEEQAAKAYNEGAVKMFGNFAKLNEV